MKSKTPKSLVNSTSSYGIHSFEVVKKDAIRISDVNESIYKDGSVHLIIHTSKSVNLNSDVKEIYIPKGPNLSQKLEKRAVKYANKVVNEKVTKPFSSTITIFSKENEPLKFKAILKENIIISDDELLGNIEHTVKDIIKGTKKNYGLTTWVISSHNIIKKPESKLNSFYSKEVNVYINTVNRKNNRENDIYIWNGYNSSKDDLGFAMSFVWRLIRELDNVSLISKESFYCQSHRFKNLIKIMFIHKKGSSKNPEYNECDKLIHVSGNEEFVLAREKSFNKNYITSDDCYIIENGNDLYQFIGKNSNKDEKDLTSKIYKQMKSWKPKAETQIIYEVESQRSHSVFEKIPDNEMNQKYNLKFLTQLEKIKIFPSNSTVNSRIQNLNQNLCYIIDVACARFLWIGEHCPIEAQIKALKEYKKTYKQDKNEHLFGQVIFRGKITKELNSCLSEVVIER